MFVDLDDFLRSYFLGMGTDSVHISEMRSAIKFTENRLTIFICASIDDILFLVNHNNQVYSFDEINGIIKLKRQLRIYTPEIYNVLKKEYSRILKLQKIISSLKPC